MTVLSNATIDEFMYDDLESVIYGRMDVAARDKWIDALLSGQYPQTKGRLKDNTGYCCFGVLSVINGAVCYSAEDEETDVALFDFRYDNAEGQRISDLGIEAMPPAEWVEQFGLHHKVMDRLAQANDEGYPFTDIAEWIRTHL